MRRVALRSKDDGCSRVGLALLCLSAERKRFSIRGFLPATVSVLISRR